MPEIDDLVAIKVIRREENQYNKSRTSIISFTVYAHKSDQKVCMNAGIDYFIAKPFKECLSLIKIKHTLQRN